MTDTIAPALTPEEWHHHAKRLDPWSVISFGGSIAVEGPDPQEAVALIEPGAIAALMAAANYELPDDSEYKITRQWITDLAVAQAETRKAVRVDCLNGPCEDCMAACERFCARLQRMADVIAALLPPE